jgi:genome maintenance exonuclease 1
MVDLIQALIKRKYKYEPLTRVDGEGGRKYVYGDTRLPSVTTILSGTKDQSHLDDWVKRVGQEQADKIKNDASIVGTHLHSVIERMVLGRSLPPPKNWLMCKGYEMGYRIVNTYFEHLSEIWGSEVMLYYPEKYAGTTDLVGVYRGKPCIIDFKQTNKMKKREWIEDYFHQLAAYALATGLKSIPGWFSWPHSREALRSSSRAGENLSLTRPNGLQGSKSSLRRAKNLTL